MQNLIGGSGRNRVVVLDLGGGTGVDGLLDRAAEG
jgi:hypothetical protein